MEEEEKLRKLSAELRKRAEELKELRK